MGYQMVLVKITWKQSTRFVVYTHLLIDNAYASTIIGAPEVTKESKYMTKPKQRAYGIDIARLTSMFMVVLLHNLGRGGVLDWTLDSIRDLAYMAIEN